MSTPFGIKTEGRLTIMEIGNKTTVWLHGSIPVAFAISGYGTVKVAEAYIATVNKAIRAIPAKQQLSVEEFNARLALLSHGLDNEAVNVTQRPSWQSAERAIEQGTDLIERGL